MSSVPSQLISSLDALEEGSFEDALFYADHVIKLNDKNFWGWCLGAIALGYLKDNSALAFYLKKASDILPNSSYVKYLKAYQYMTEARQADAVVELAGLVEGPNGWFARDLLEKIRLGKGIQRAVDQGDLGTFILLPDLKKELLSISQDLPSNEKFEKKEEKIPALVDEGEKTRFHFKKQARLFFILLTLLITGIAFTIFFYFDVKYFETPPKWEKLEISPKTRILSKISPRQFIFSYKEPQDIIHDFEKAKSFLRLKKVNQSRYLLQKILNSNADFQAKEKSKIFLNFIPELSVEEFDDPVNPDQIITEPIHYQYAQILWEGKVHSNKVKGNGRELEILVNYNQVEYIVHAFISLGELDSRWKPYDSFKNKADQKVLKTTSGEVVLFGKFKGLIGNQKKFILN